MVSQSTYLLPQVSAKRAIRLMGGGSQAVLIECDDGNPYIVKFANNPQGPNILANEFLGHSLASSIGLPVPGSAFINVSQTFLDIEPFLFLTKGGTAYRPRPGIHFGTRLIGGGNEELSRLKEYLSVKDVDRVANVDAFFGMYVFDVWTSNQDHRQAVFEVDQETRALHAVFIDNGHLFGGPEWSYFGRNRLGLHVQQMLYTRRQGEADLCTWVERFRETLPDALSEAIRATPRGWHSGNLAWLKDTLLNRLATLDTLLQEQPIARSCTPTRTP